MTTLQATLNTLYFSVRYAFHGLESMTERQEGYLTGYGEALIFMDGKQIIGTWEKDSRTARTLLFDSAGNPIKLDRGTIWFEILPTDGVATDK